MFRLQITLALCLASMSGYAQESNHTIEGILARWKERQQSSQTFKATWTQSTLYGKGGYSQAYPASVDPATVFPTEDTTFEERGILSMDSQKARYEFYGFAFAPSQKKFISHDYTAIYDGQSGAIMHEGNESGVTLVTKQSGHRPLRLAMVTNAPILRAFRPVAREMGAYDIDGFSLSGRKAVINTVECVELVLRNPPTGVAVSMWLATEQDYHIIRHQQSLQKGNYSVLQYDIAYRKDTEGRWLPANWTYVTKARSGALVTRLKATVTECTVQGKVPTSLFELTPPKKSRVTEYDKNDTTVGHYIVRADGTRRDVVRGEESLGFRVLENSEPGEPIGQPTGSFAWRNRVLLAGVVLFILGLCGVLIRRRRLNTP